MHDQLNIPESNQLQGSDQLNIRTQPIVSIATHVVVQINSLIYYKITLMN